jgi:hypothetical protein
MSAQRSLTGGKRTLLGHRQIDAFDPQPTLDVGRMFGLDYRKLRLEPLCYLTRLSRGTVPHEREHPRRKDRF